MLICLHWSPSFNEVYGMDPISMHDESLFTKTHCITFNMSIHLTTVHLFTVFKKNLSIIL